MRLLRSALIALVFASVAQACAVEGPGTDSDRAKETVGQVSQSLTTQCSFDTIGLPCDPDGPAGAKLECEGLCAIGLNGYVACVGVATAGQMNGVVCGTTNGVGDNACKRVCSGKSCMAANAPAGAGCRLSVDGNPCEGQCTGSGACVAVADPCTYGREGQLCHFATCNLAAVSECQVKNLIKNTLCSDTDACSVGKCTAQGACIAGPTIGCNDGNACTDDSCDPNDGGCLGTNDDTNACSDGNACTTGEYCTAGECVTGTVPVDCDDQNQCTGDSCDPNTGCAHIPKSCSDGDACTADSCDPSTGGCFSKPLSCADANPCTLDGCDSLTGCSNVMKNCDDLDPCTADSCDSNGDCLHTVIGGCGTGGGAGTGGFAGSGGVAGNGGMGGVGGTDTAGTGGSAIAGTGGSISGGSAGTDSGGSGTAGTNSGGSGAGGNAGTDSGGSSAGGNAGTASGGSSAGGNAGTTSGGSSSAGSGGMEAAAGSPDMSTAGDSGMSTGGSAVGGSEADGGTPSATGGNTKGGSSTAAGGADQGGADEGGTKTRVVHDSGCGCRVPSQPTNGSLAWLVGLLGAVAVVRRRRAA